VRSRLAKLDWPGVVAFTLALGVSVSLIIGMTGAALNAGPLGEKTSSLLATLGGAAIGAIATYLGLARQQQQQNQRTRSSDAPRTVLPPDAPITRPGE
jgi:purine-cytosine permease-like protein